MTESDSRRQAGVQSIEVGAAILFALVRIGRPASLTEIAEATSTVPAKLHRYLASMIKSDLVVQPRKAGSYALGPGAIEIGLSAIQQNDFCAIIGGHLGEVRDALDVTCFGAVLGNRGPTVVAQAVSYTEVAVHVRVGSVLPMTGTSTGWTFSACLSDRQYQAVCGVPRSSIPATVRRRLAQIRDAGWAHVTDEYVRSISAISIPVFGMYDQLEGVITALGPTGNFDNSISGPIGTRLRETGDQISRSLGAARSRRTT